MGMMLVSRIETLFDRYGRRRNDHPDAEPVSPLAHALQCAQLAEAAGAQTPMIAAALLHDIGHILHAPRSPDESDDVHELQAMLLLAPMFGPEVVEPIRWHVQAKRYLVTTDTRYLGGLTRASAQALAVQGGPMSRDERLAFETLPFAQQALQLRRWDDLAKEPGKAVPPLARYLSVLLGLAGRAEAPHLLSDALELV